MAERDEKGRFLGGKSGNPKGRPTKEREARYYELLLTTVSEDDWKAIILKAKDEAKRGDQAARKWLSDYLVGPPVQKSEVDATVKATVMSWREFIEATE